MLKDFFKENQIVFIDKKVKWDEGIQIGVDILKKNKSATQELFDRIIESTNKFGPYYIIVPKIALAHASPGEWSIKPDLSFVFLKETVAFSEKPEHEVKIVITMSATDADSHLELLQKFIAIFSDKNLYEKILNCDSKLDLMSLEEWGEK